MRLSLVGLLTCAALLHGCANSAVRTAFDPNVQYYEKDQYRIAVLQQGEHWSAWYQSASIMALVPDQERLKPIQIEAIEHISGCSVTHTSANHHSGLAAHLLAKVDCSEKP